MCFILLILVKISTVISQKRYILSAMGIELFFALVALVLVPLTNGSYKKLFSTKFKSKWALLFVAAGLLTINYAPIPHSRFNDLGFGILIATYVFLIGFIVANLNYKSLWIALVGISSNAIVIALNQGMPVKASGNYVPVDSIKHQAATSKDLLKPLSDIIVINKLKVAISVGDIIFGFGLILACIMLSRKDKASAPVEEFELEEIIDENFADREELVVDNEMTEPAEEIRPVQPVLFTIESQVMPATTMENDLEFIEQVQVLDDMIKQQNNVEDEIEYEVVEAPGMETVAENIEENETLDLEVEKAHDEDENIGARKYMSSSRKKKSRRTGFSALPSKEELGFSEESMEIVDAAN